MAKIAAKTVNTRLMRSNTNVSDKIFPLINGPGSGNCPGLIIAKLLSPLSSLTANHNKYIFTDMYEM